MELMFCQNRGCFLGLRIGNFILLFWVKIMFVFRGREGEKSYNYRQRRTELENKIQAIKIIFLIGKKDSLPLPGPHSSAGMIP